MAETFYTLADLVKINDKNAIDVDCSDIFNDAPLLLKLAAVVASNGTNHKYIKESTAPTVGFRAINAGKENSASGDTLVEAALKLLDASFHADKAAADAYKGGPEAFLAREAKRHLRQAFFVFEKQILNGTVGGAAGGFTGFANATTMDALADAYVVNATGTTANTGSSVYLLRTGDDMRDVAAVIGNDGELEIGDSVQSSYQTRTEDGDGVVTATGWYPTYMTPILGHVGLQMGSAASVVRICNLTEDSGKGLTDALIYKALEKFPASRMPNLIVMNRRSRRQLQSSRTATNATGAPVPLPKEVEGIEIVTTDALLSTEALIS